jgi:two-component system NtrC family response regulator
MRKRPVEILLVENDSELAELIEGYLLEALSARVTSVGSAGDALRMELTHPHDVVLAALSLPDGDGLEFTRRLRVSNKCPVILMAESPTVDQMVGAIRLGVKDVLLKPFDLAAMADVVSAAIRSERTRRRRRRRYRRLRLLTGRIMHERRDLRERTDLICQDLVHAYRRLAQKIAESSVLSDE